MRKHNSNLLRSFTVINHTKSIIFSVKRHKKLYEISWDKFTSEPNNDKPNFERVSIIDWGQTLKLGLYEVSTDWLISEASVIFERKR